MEREPRDTRFKPTAKNLFSREPTCKKCELSRAPEHLTPISYQLGLRA